MFMDLNSGGFDWASLSRGSVVVDVGGGLGGADIELAKNFKHVQYICQDRPRIVEQADKVWHFPSSLDVLKGFTSAVSTFSRCGTYKATRT